MSDAEAIPGTISPPWWLQLPLYAYLKLTRVQVKPRPNKISADSTGTGTQDISQAPGQSADAEAMHGDCRSP